MSDRLKFLVCFLSIISGIGVTPLLAENRCPERIAVEIDSPEYLHTTSNYCSNIDIARSRYEASVDAFAAKGHNEVCEEECQKIAGTPTCEGVQIGDTTGDGKEDPAEVLAYGFECTPENERDYIRTQASNSSPASCNDGETALIPLLAFLLTGDLSNLDTTQSTRATGSTGRRGPLGSIAYNADVVCGGSAILLLQCWCVNYDDDSGIVSNSGH